MQAVRRSERIAPAIAVAALHILLGYMLIAGLRVDVSGTIAEGLKVFDVREPPIPPPTIEPVPPPLVRAGASSPPPRAAPAPILSVPRRLPALAPTVVSVPEPAAGSRTETGSSNFGSGSGGIGSGTGAGGTGAGSEKLAAVRARFLKGRISGSDYPRAARQAGAEGTVFVRFAVDSNGKPGDCVVTASSGNAALDAATCRLIERRFRYAPARDYRGQAVDDVVIGNQRWWIRSD